jgi:hypothetical protein
MHLAYAVVTRGRPFDPAYRSSGSEATETSVEPRRFERTAFSTLTTQGVGRPWRAAALSIDLAKPVLMGFRRSGCAAETTT